ncbi:alpha/beta hydrolase [Dactylosporangium sp. NPDC005572]|uniref:alpha/beta fold hydrolase n=1 Tax=Dactylosporangium sp. NPDC005572 TaxID=3156889 RepID=UPI00339E6542
MSEFFTAYDAVLARWPVAVEPVDVPSSYGTTRINACGPAGAPALVLLHGGGATSTVWFATVGELSRDHRVYAVDTIGDAGRSVADGRPIDHMDWLDGVLDGLGLDRATLCGHSYGGWIALSYAVHAPHRVDRLALLDPTDCFSGLRLAYRLRAVPVLARPTPERLRALVRWETAGAPLDEGWLRLMCLGATFPKSRLVLPRRPAAAPLLPVLVLLAERSRAHDIRAVAATAERLLPDVSTAVLPGASHHTIPTEHARHLTRELTRFLV